MIVVIVTLYSYSHYEGNSYNNRLYVYVTNKRLLKQPSTVHVTYKLPLAYLSTVHFTFEIPLQYVNISIVNVMLDIPLKDLSTMHAMFEIHLKHLSKFRILMKPFSNVHKTQTSHKTRHNCKRYIYSSIDTSLFCKPII